MTRLNRLTIRLQRKQASIFIERMKECPDLGRLERLEREIETIKRKLGFEKIFLEV